MKINKPVFKTLSSDWVKDSLWLTALLFCFYAFALGSYPLFTPDEGRYSEVAREMLATGNFITPQVNGIPFLDKPILYYWLQAAAIALFGIKEWALRLFPMLFGLLGCLLTYICGRYLFDRKTALFSAIILATMPLYYCGAHYANLDLEVAVLISNSLLCYLTAMQLDGGKRLYFCLAAYTFSALAVLTKGLIGLAFPCLIVGSWIVVSGRYEVLKRSYIALGILLMAVIILPWYLLVQKYNPTFFHYFFVTQHFTRFTSGAEFNNKIGLWFYLPVIFIGTFPWSYFLIQALIHPLRALYANRKNHSVELFLLLWIALVFTFFSIPHSKIITYILPIFPALALLLGHYFSTVLLKINGKTIQKTTRYFAIYITTFLLALVLGTQLDWIKIPITFKFYFYSINIILLIGALLASFYQRITAKQLFILNTSMSILLALSLILGAESLNQNSAKTLVSYLKSIVQPQDEIVTYYKYYQDVPLYLGKKIAIVADWNPDTILAKDNWQRELWFGKNNIDQTKWLPSETTFWQHWHSEQRVFAFLNANYFDQFKKQAQYYFFIGRANDILLLSNKPTLLSLKNFMQTPKAYWR